jgi:hypothetical protein
MKTNVKAHLRNVKSKITGVRDHERTVKTKPKTIWIFGYGSLLYPDGINGRGMHYNYTENDLHEVVLKGYKREWNALSGIRFLGVVESPFSWCNGVIFQIHSDEGLENFKRSEHIGEVYDLVDVTDKVEPRPENAIIKTCVTINPTSDGRIADYYIDIINIALKYRGLKFKKDFIKTTAHDEAVEYEE